MIFLDNNHIQIDNLQKISDYLDSNININNVQYKTTQYITDHRKTKENTTRPEKTAWDKRIENKTRQDMTKQDTTGEYSSRRTTEHDKITKHRDGIMQDKTAAHHTRGARQHGS